MIMRTQKILLAILVFTLYEITLFANYPDWSNPSIITSDTYTVKLWVSNKIVEAGKVRFKVEISTTASFVPLTSYRVRLIENDFFSDTELWRDSKNVSTGVSGIFYEYEGFSSKLVNELDRKEELYIEFRYYITPILYSTIQVPDILVDVYSDDDCENNDSQSAAYNIGIGNGFIQQLIMADGDDWYKFQITEYCNATIKLDEFFNEAGDFDLYLYDSTGDMIGQSITYENNEQIVRGIRGGIYYIRVSTAESGRGWYDLHFSMFPIYLNLTSPNGGEEWKKGYSFNITWTDNLSDNVRIDLYNGSSHARTISSSTSSDGSFRWTIPTDLPRSSRYRIKITSTSNSQIYDYSNNYFAICEDDIRIITPNGGENWKKGSSYDITWVDNISSNVKIDLYNGSSHVRTISYSTSNDGIYRWTIPTDIPVSLQYWMQITSTADSHVFDRCNDYFTISEAPSLVITSPNGGEDWECGSRYDITWVDNISSNVKIDLYNGSSHVRTISFSTSSDGIYRWTIPTDIPVSSQYWMQITSTTDSHVFDRCNNYFTIELGTYIIEVEGGKKLNIYPNPTEGALYISTSLDLPDDYTIKLIDYRGQVLKIDIVNGLWVNENYNFDISSFRTGIYIVEIEGEDFKKQVKIVKE